MAVKIQLCTQSRILLLICKIFSCASFYVQILHHSVVPNIILCFIWLDFKWIRGGICDLFCERSHIAVQSCICLYSWVEWVETELVQTDHHCRDSSRASQVTSPPWSGFSGWVNAAAPTGIQYQSRFADVWWQTLNFKALLIKAFTSLGLRAAHMAATGYECVT